MSEFRDYSWMMTNLEKSMRRMHDNCLKKKWSLAAKEPGQMIVQLTELNGWLKEQKDGLEGR